jgi:ABC-2 type transport system ATP-binding protein
LSEPAPSAPGTRGVRVEARDLSRRFGSCVALAGATLDIEPGETFGLLGANGAGKTTFIRIVTGCLLPSSGSIAVDGISPAEQPTVVQSKLGFVMETSRLYPELRVVEFLRFVAGARGLRGPERTLALERSLERFQLESVASRLIGNLSKGFQQRVSLAQAFLHDPPLLIVDEPTGGLDPVQQQEVQHTLGALRGERTIILCTHDLGEAERLCSHVAVLRRGQLVTQGATNEILGRNEVLELFRDDPGATA